MERKVCVVQGLGGTGKTQAVLKVIERTYNRWKEVLYIDATTQGSIEGALKDIAIAKKVGDKYQDALIWLESYRERWLVVLDNADDPSLPLRHYIPGGNHGSIIITTRLSDVVSFARGKDSHCSVSSMDPDDALALLLKLVRRQDQELSHEEVESGKSLLQDLGHFALAIVHAGSFIGHSPHMSITKYRSLFTKQKQHALEAYSKLPLAAKVDGYTHTVYTAWFMCYETLRPQARELLWLTAFLHHTGITIDIFQRATMNILLNKPEFPTTDTEDSARQKLLECLCSFLDADQRWDELSFTESISEIVSRSLLEYDYTSQGYRIHVLVQDWVRTIVPWDADIALECAKVLLATSIPSDRNLESVRFRLSIGLHVDRVMSEISDSDEIGANHAFPFSLVYHDRGSWKRVEQLRLQIRETNERVLGSDHPQTLSSIHNLAYTYSELNRLEEAKTIYLEVLNARKRVLGDDHPDTLSNMSNLAVTYSQLGRLEEAIELQVKVLDSHKRLLGIENHGTLSVMHSLAVTYSKLGRLEEARILETQVLDLRKRVLGNDHPDTLSSMHNLSHTWSMLNQMEEARELQVQVLNSRKRVLGNDHPDTLLSMHGLACLYSELCRFEEARDMHSQVLDARKRALGIDHPDTLSRIRNLANTLSRLGQLREARDLMAQALDTHKRVLGNDHPKTLKNMSNLACVYFQLDQLDEARDLYVQVLDAHERVLGYDHPSTLITRDDLACTYLKLGLREDAEKLRVDTDKLVQRLGENCESTPAERDQPRKFQGRRAKRILPKIASAWSKLKGA